MLLWEQHRTDYIFSKLEEIKSIPNFEKRQNFLRTFLKNTERLSIFFLINICPFFYSTYVTYYFRIFKLLSNSTFDHKIQGVLIFFQVPVIRFSYRLKSVLHPVQNSPNFLVVPRILHCTYQKQFFSFKLLKIKIPNLCFVLVSQLPPSLTLPYCMEIRFCRR